MTRRAFERAAVVACLALFLGRIVAIHADREPAEEFPGPVSRGELAKVEKWLDISEAIDSRGGISSLALRWQIASPDSIRRLMVLSVAPGGRDQGGRASYETDNVASVVALYSAVLTLELDGVMAFGNPEFAAHLASIPWEQQAILRRAYPALGTESEGSFSYSPSEVPDGWARDTLGLRLAEIGGDEKRAEELRERMISRGEEALGFRIWAVPLVWSATIVAVIATLLAFARLLPWRAGQSPVPPPWTAMRGIGVFAVCVAAIALIDGLIRIAILPLLVSFEAFRLAMLTIQIAYVMEILLPLGLVIWLSIRYLTRPSKLLLTQAAGLPDSVRGVGFLLCFGLFLVALENIGIRGIEALIGQFSAEASPTGKLPRLSGGLGWTTLGGANVVLQLGVGPLLEEILYRGVLYGAMRVRMTALPAAVISSLVFSAVHPGSLVSHIEVLWLGIVLSWGYERSRSLLPPTIAHGFLNAGSLYGL